MPYRLKPRTSPTELLTRIDRLEAAIRNLTGNIEQLQYHNQQLEQQVQRLQAEVQGGAPVPSATPQRPGAQYLPPASTPPVVAAAPPIGSLASPRPQYSAPPPGPPPVIAATPIAPPAPIESAPPASTTRRGDAFDPSANPNAPGVPRPLGTSTAATEPPPPVAEGPPGSGPRQIVSPLDLSRSPPSAGAVPRGELPAPPPVNTSATGAMQATLPPGNTARDEYDLAYGYVLHRDYSLAADAFRVFLRQYPSDRLAPEALYWLGESLFQQQKYRDAAEFVPHGLDEIRDHGTRAGGAIAAGRVACGIGRKGSSLCFARRGAAQISTRRAECKTDRAAGSEAWSLLTRLFATTKRTRCSVVLKICAGSFLPCPVAPNSTALLVLAARWAKGLSKRHKHPPKLAAVTIDHGLRRNRDAKRSP